MYQGSSCSDAEWETSAIGFSTEEATFGLKKYNTLFLLRIYENSIKEFNSLKTENISRCSIQT